MMKSLGLIRHFLLLAVLPAVAFSRPLSHRVAAVTTPPAQGAAAQEVAAERLPSAPTKAIKRTIPHRAPSAFYAGFGFSFLNNQGFTGLMPIIFGGYGARLGHTTPFYAGLEVFGGAGSLPLSPNQRYRVTRLMGASVLPGYAWNDWTLLFTRIGVASAYYSNLNETKTGGLFGVGLQSALSDHWDFRVEYDYGTNQNLNQYNFDFIYRF